jgi:hypothetical protein
MDSCPADLYQQRPAFPNGGIASHLPSLCADEASLVVEDWTPAAEVSSMRVALPGRFFAGFEERCDTGNARSGHLTTRDRQTGKGVVECDRMLAYPGARPLDAGQERSGSR